jgi:hypothetical protein
VARASSGNDLAVRQVPVGALRAARPGERDRRAQAPFEQRRAGDVVGMHVRFEREFELQAQFLDQRRVAPRVLEHRVDQHRLARERIGEQVGVGGGLRIEQLAENHEVR